ncbi:MAG TPA: CxxxxCH/CxxCH domain-containing protein [Candidatus Deferrimicrobiaceae bacterium]|jgi:predicted CxxxxCH...CXXCH cytochrome family protein
MHIDAFVISPYGRFRSACAVFIVSLSLLGLSPGSASALAKHNLYPETTDCGQCHVMSSSLVEDNTSYLRAGARSIPTMKSLNGNRVPSSKAAFGPKGVGCTFCHFNTGSATRMKDVLEQFNGKMSQHPVDRTYTLDNAATTRNVSLSANTNTTRWMSNWDNSWTGPANQVGCIDCHDVTNTTSPGTGPGGYPEHTDASSATRTANPVMLRGGASSWNGAISHASNSFCINICHNGVGAGTGGYRMGHYGWGAFDNAGSTGQLKEPSKAPLRTSNCVDCHETHYSGSQKSLFGELGDTGRLLPSQSTNLVAASNCTNICHNDNTYVAVGHGRPTSTSGIAMGVVCIQCHDSSLSHRSPTNPKRLFREDTNKATLTENLASNGLDDDFDGVVDNPEEAGLKRSGESNCSAGSCHADRHLHSGSGKINGTPGSASCLHCHDMHGNGVDNNIRMIKSTIMGKTVRYWSKTDYLRADNSATVASLCDNPGCHQKPLGNVGTPGTILHDVSEHVQANVGPGTDCSGCHSHSSSSGSGSFLPACNNCHAYPGQAYVAGTHPLSSIHAKHVDPTTGYGYVCSVCHYQNAVHNASGVSSGSDWSTKFVGSNVKVRFDGAVNPLNGFGPTYNGVAADNGSVGASGIGTASTPGNGSCQGLYCHANSASTRAWSGYAGAPTWNDNTSGACGTCHKATFANPPTYGSHRKHVDNTTVGYGIACNTCHYATTSDGLTITNRAVHVNAAAPQSLVSWNPNDNDVKNAGAYTLASKTCSNVYCHSTGTKINQSVYDNGAYGWPKWTDNGAITCNHCHGDGTRTDGTPDYANNSPKINSHPKHIAAGDGCQMCHAQTTTDGLTISNRTNHVNAFYNVNNDNAAHSFSYTVPTCTGIACHGTNAAQWGGASPQCSDCHLGTGDTNQFQTANATWYAAGVAASIDNTEWFYSGHGRKTTNYDVSGNPPADFGTKAGTGNPCAYCHDAGVAHRVSTNPFRLKVQTGVTGYTNAGWNATCLVCHSKTTTPPGYQPAGAALVTGAATDRVDTAHYGGKHATDNTGGGSFCWDCHDAHGNRSNGTTGNIYMMQRNVLPKTDGLYGARGASGELNAGLVFLSDNMVAGGGDWARTDYKGLCQVCHHGTGAGTSSQAKYYTQSSDNTSHNSTLPCLSCHAHDNNLGASCTGCHGDGGNRIWPQKPGVGPASKVSLTADYNYNGDHLSHLTQIATRLGGYNLADNTTWSQAQQQAICLYCHDYAADATHATAGPRAKLFPATGSRMLGGSVDNGSPAFVTTDNSCTSVQCHNRKGTTATFNWYTGSAKQCSMCHTPGGVLDNNPRSGLHAVTAAGVTKHDNSLPVGLNGQGGCQSCHWNTGWPAQSPNQTHINGVVADNLAGTLNRPNLSFTDCTVNRNRVTCSGFAPGSGLDNAVGIGCHSDRGAWKRLWSTEADNTATVVGSPRCNVCHGQWKTIAGSAGWRDNTTHFNVSGKDNDIRGKGHDGAPESCDVCHVYASGSARHDNAIHQVNINSNGSSFAASGTRAGCSACHEGATGTANAHDFPLSVFPLGTVSGSVIPMPACDTCHDKNAAGTAPKVFDKAGGYATGNGQRTTAYGSHLTRTTGEALSAATNWVTQCTYCHAGHSGTPVTIPLPDNNYTDNNGGVGLNMQAVLGINYTINGGIHLGGTATVGTTEARICWNCHWSDATLSASKTEFGVNNNFNTGAMVYDYGSLSTANTTDNNGWYAANGTTPATWNAVSTAPSFAYKAGALQSMHSTAMSAGKPKAAGPGNKTLADIRCSYCHDVHDLNKATRTTTGTNPGTYSDNVTGQPYLRGTWRGNPFKEDGAPTGTALTAYSTTWAPFRNVPRGSTAQTEMGGYWINQNTPGADTTAVAGSAGLCVLCHNSEVNTMNIFGDPAASWVGTGNGHANSAIGGTGTASGKSSNIFNLRGGTAGNTTNPAMHFTGASDPGDGSPYGFRGNSGSSAKFPPTATPRAFGTNTWMATVDGTTTDNKFHQFLCSKCHNPHASRLPRLMITNCLDVKHNTWQTAAVGLPTGAQFGTLNKNRRISSWTSAQNCHRLTQWSDNATTGAGWNKVTPW